MTRLQARAVVVRHEMTISKKPGYQAKAGMFRRGLMRTIFLSVSRKNKRLFSLQIRHVRPNLANQRPHRRTDLTCSAS